VTFVAGVAGAVAPPDFAARCAAILAAKACRAAICLGEGGWAMRAYNIRQYTSSEPRSRALRFVIWLLPCTPRDSFRKRWLSITFLLLPLALSRGEAISIDVASAELPHVGFGQAENAVDSEATLDPQLPRGEVRDLFERILREKSLGLFARNVRTRRMSAREKDAAATRAAIKKFAPTWYDRPIPKSSLSSAKGKPKVWSVEWDGGDGATTWVLFLNGHRLEIPATEKKARVFVRPYFPIVLTVAAKNENGESEKSNELRLTTTTHKP
jgi:hypothetical protein